MKKQNYAICSEPYSRELLTAAQEHWVTHLYVPRHDELLALFIRKWPNSDIYLFYVMASALLWSSSSFSPHPKHSWDYLKITHVFKLNSLENTSDKPRPAVNNDWFLPSDARYGFIEFKKSQAVCPITTFST